MFTGPVSNIAGQHNLGFHGYADEPGDCLSKSISKMESCISQIRSWMAQNMLKLNDDKTEVIMFGSRHQLSNIKILLVKIGETEITPSPFVKNLGVYSPSQLTMEKHVNHVCRTGRMHIRNII